MKQNKPVGRPIGKKLPAMLEFLDQHGPCRNGVIVAAIDLPANDVMKVAKRGLERGLLTISETKPRFYTVVPGWREVLEARAWQKPPATKMRAPAVNSVFALGAL